MQSSIASVKWMTFGLSDALNSTLVHFFPSAGAITAPYPAHCTLSIFGRGLSPNQVVLDGARLSQPDGVRVEDAFSEIREQNINIFGIQIEIGSSQAKLNLSHSLCIIELSANGLATKFHPVRIEDPLVEGLRNFAAIKDCFQQTSLISVNPTSEIFRPAVYSLRADGQTQELGMEGVLPGSAHEQFLPDSLFEGLKPQQCSWGLARVRSVLIKPVAEVSQYIVYRDPVTRRPMSVCKV